MTASDRPFDEDVMAIIRDLGAAEDLADVLPHSSRDRVLIEKTVEALHAQLLAVLDHLDDDDDAGQEASGTQVTTRTGPNARRGGSTGTELVGEGMPILGPGSEWFWAAARCPLVAVSLIAMYRQLRAESAASEGQGCVAFRSWVSG